MAPKGQIHRVDYLWERYPPARVAEAVEDRPLRSGYPGMRTPRSSRGRPHGIRSDPDVAHLLAPPGPRSQLRRGHHDRLAEVLIGQLVKLKGPTSRDQVRLRSDRGDQVEQTNPGRPVLADQYVGTPSNSPQAPNALEAIDCGMTARSVARELVERFEITIQDRDPGPSGHVRRPREPHHRLLQGSLMCADLGCHT